jgi:putative nucleotidyltransferase with HDIG domain
MIRPRDAAAGLAIGMAIAQVAWDRRMRRRAERFTAAALESLLRAIDANDPDTGAHVRRVAGYALVLSDAIGCDESTRRTIELTGLFHDIGKIHEAMFDIVHDDVQLTPSDRRAIHQHPVRGAEVLAPIANFHPQLADAVLSHHERWDGTGYPRKLEGDAIPLAARVVALADAFDAITYGRLYRDARTAQEAERIFAAGRGTQFDPDLVDLMLLPPVFAGFLRLHRTTARHVLRHRRARGKTNVKKAPEVRIRWRTRSAPPEGVPSPVTAPLRGSSK